MASGNKSLRLIRYTIQFYFLAFTLFIGWRFFLFVRHFETGSALVTRPPSVEGFLPIAGLMSFKYLIFNGMVEPVHPAGLFIFIGAVAVSLLVRKGFCGWICPVGTISQYVWMASEAITRRRFRVEKYTDISVRSLKYMLMAMFLFLIGIAMPPHMMVLFFLSDYYKIADVKTMKFFTEMSSTAFWSLTVIGGFSLLYRNVWCRYLCPYGALLGLLAKLGPAKITRNEQLCIHCHQCTKTCPSSIEVEKTETVNSAECFGCLTCVSHCPSEGALEVTAGYQGKRKKIPALAIPAAVLALFFLIISIGMLTGRWQTAIPYEEYQRVIPKHETLAHP